MKMHYLKLKNWLLVTVMGAFGLSSCHCHKEVAQPQEEEVPAVKPRNEMRLMYGVPTMNFMIRGQVKDADGLKCTQNVFFRYLSCPEHCNLAISENSLKPLILEAIRRLF